MKIGIFLELIILGVFANSCQTPSPPISHEKFKSELFAVEKDFCAMAQSEGVQNAFLYYAADSAVILRKEKVLKGKESIRRQYESFPRNAKLEWAPDFADVSASGDMGYTYGKYTFTSTDSIGKIIQSAGVFHTVWKRQPDSKWRFVWD